ncbi:MAG: radical SAM protein [Acidobacteriota bacterium]
MDLLIINPRIMWFSSKSMIANGPITLGSYLHGKGFGVRVIDDNSAYRKYTTKDYISYIEEHDFKVIGFSVNTLNAYNSYTLAETLRKRFPEKILIGGGLQSFDAPKEMGEQVFDVVFKGEAELAVEKFLNLAKEYSPDITRTLFEDDGFVSRLKEIQGLILNVNGETTHTTDGFCELVQNLDDVPFNNYDLINLDDYIKWKYDHHMVTNQLNFQRGCPYACTFCKSAVIAQKLRNNSGRFMVKEIAHRYQKFGLSNFFVTDSNFTISKPRLIEFCQEMISSGLNKKVNLMVQTSIAIPLNDDEIELMQQAGVTMFLIGLERFGDNNRKLIKKAGSGKLASDIVKKLHAHNLKSVVNILINFKFESEETLAEEGDLIAEHIPYVGHLYINYLTPMPGTPIYEDEIDAKFKRWYLNKEIATHRVSYYDMAYLIEGPLALKMNIFGQSPKMLNAMRRFKEKYQWMGNLAVAKSPGFRALLMTDMLVGKLSYYVARVSPRLEDVLFGPLKYLRQTGYKILFNRFLSRSEGSKSQENRIAETAESQICG